VFNFFSSHPRCSILIEHLKTQVGTLVFCIRTPVVEYTFYAIPFTHSIEMTAFLCVFVSTWPPSTWSQSPGARCCIPRPPAPLHHPPLALTAPDDALGRLGTPQQSSTVQPSRCRGELLFNVTAGLLPLASRSGGRQNKTRQDRVAGTHNGLSPLNIDPAYVYI